MKNINYCYHTHTFRCGHASGTDEEYVLHALNLGIKYMGFSDHVMLPGIYQSNCRANYEMLDDYINSVHKLQVKYKIK